MNLTPFFFTVALNAEDVPLANGSMSFNRVCREWRCKYTGNKSGKFQQMNKKLYYRLLQTSTYYYMRILNIHSNPITKMTNHFILLIILVSKLNCLHPKIINRL